MKYTTFAFVALCCCLCNALQAQKAAADRATSKGPWKDISELALPRTDKSELPLPDKFRLLELDNSGLKNTLQEVSRSGNSERTTIIDIPMPDGSFQQFSMENMPVMHPELAAKFPEIHSFSGSGITDPRAKIYFDYSPVGFHALILSSGKGQIIIEPVQKNDAIHYLCYDRKDIGAHSPVVDCGVRDKEEFQQLRASNAEFASDCRLRTYRLAMASTGEYTAASISATDATGVNTTMANINALVTFMNGIFINECGIQLQLVANNNAIIFTNASTDGYTNGDQNAMATDSENQAIMDANIGDANYDIAHALGTRTSGGGGSGVSQHIGNACVSGNKANAATIMNSTNLLGFAELILHEIGHQFGANHTFNEAAAPICSNSGQLNSATAYEPGSGSTIMSYSGTCGPSNVQGNRDMYYHTISLQEIGNYTSIGSGNCPAAVSTGNSAPVVSVSGGTSFTIPANTAFRLTASGSDVDGDALTYCWEQFDNQLITHPPQSTAANGPVFRSLPAVSSPSRYFPNLQAILNGTSPVWEVLPAVSRSMNFIVTARDNAPGGGCTDEASANIAVDGNSGPFKISRIGADAACLTAEENTTINWEVAKTNLAPVNCANVDIWLSLDGGENFTVLLASATPNDGSQQVFIPASAITTEGRIMVIGTGNIFLAINDRDIRIDCPRDRIVTDNPASGVYKVRETLQTAGTVTVQPGTNARFYAGENITMKPGFWAQAGSDFLARIKPCDPCVAGKSETIAAGPENPNVYYYDVPSDERSVIMTTGKAMNAVAFPNPFDRNFTLRFDLPEAGKVEIRLMDFSGRQIQTLYQNDYLEAGTHQIPLTITQLENGLYDCQIISNDNKARIKLVKIN